MSDEEKDIIGIKVKLGVQKLIDENEMLQDKVYKLQDIIKEVREINNYIYRNIDRIDFGELKCKLNRTLEILDKDSDK